jgi:hypothetical protein
MSRDPKPLHDIPMYVEVIDKEKLIDICNKRGIKCRAHGLSPCPECEAKLRDEE